MQRRVEDLCLELSLDSPCRYTLTGSLYCLSWLVRLEVSLYCFSLDRTISIRWPYLKVLSTEHVELSDDFLGGIFRGSPVLDSLDLFGCWGVKNTIIDSTSAKQLFSREVSVEKIWAPHLLSLRVLGPWDDHCICRLDDISSLAEAKLISDIPTGDKRVCYNLLKELLEKLPRVPTIAIGGSCLQVLSLFEIEGVPSPLSKCQNLTLHAPVSQWDLPGITYLLRSSQCLEKLVIHLPHPSSLLKFELDEESEDRFDFDEEDFFCSQKGNFQCFAKHLKRVEIIGIEANEFASKHLLALIKFLLGDALALEKLIIKVELRRWHGEKRLQAVSRKVLSYRRASKNAEVIFNYPSKELPF